MMNPHPADLQTKRALEIFRLRSAKASACPRLVAGKRCLVPTHVPTRDYGRFFDRPLCICQKHQFVLDHRRLWRDTDNRLVLTSEPYEIDSDALAAYIADLAELGLKASIRGRSLWKPGLTFLIIVTQQPVRYDDDVIVLADARRRANQAMKETIL